MEDRSQKVKTAASNLSPDPLRVRREQENRQADAAKKYAASERIGFEFKSGAPTKADRTLAQREASRRNGARSCGPLTAEGKVRSRANSLKHGLLATLVCPPGDIRDHDRLYRRIRKELNAEFEPATFTQRAAVDKLAKLYLQSGRAEEMIESLQRLAGCSQKDAEAYSQLQKDRRDFRHLTRLIAQLGKGEQLTGDPDAVDALADRVCNYVESVQHTLSEDTIPVAEMNEFERKEDHELKQEWAKLRPVKAKLTDRKYLSSVLSGSVATTPAVLCQLWEVLRRFCKGVGVRIENAAGIEKSVMQARQQTVRNLANEPERLMVLQRYANGIERSIRRLIAQLR